MDELDIWDPFKKIRRQENFSRFFDSFPKFDSMIRSPLLDIKDSGKNLKVTAELPGLRKENIDIDVTENMLTLKGKMDLEKQEKNKKKGYYFKERKASSYYRTVSLPAEVIPSKAKANFKDGILELVIPKKHVKKSKSHKVKVK